MHFSGGTLKETQPDSRCFNSRTKHACSCAVPIPLLACVLATGCCTVLLLYAAPLTHTCWDQRLPYALLDVLASQLTMAAEVRRLSAASFGVTLLRCIGSVYTAHADMALGGLLGGALARVRDGGAAVRCHLDVASAALRVAGHQERLAAFERQCAEQREQQVVATGPSPAPDSDCQVTVELGGGGAGDTCKVGTGSGAGHLRSGDESQPAAQQPLPNTADEAFATRREALETDGARLLLEAMWAANVLDLRTTLSRVCRAVLYDPRASSGLRRRRARALRCGDQRVGAPYADDVLPCTRFCFLGSGQ